MGTSKFFAMDVDGTFITYDFKLPSKNKQAFDKLAKSSTIAFFCTGNDYLSV